MDATIQDAAFVNLYYSPNRLLPLLPVKVFLLKTSLTAILCTLFISLVLEACLLQYVGSTMRKLKTRIKEHIFVIRSNTLLTHNIYSAFKHFLHEHTGDISHLKVIGIEKRGGDWARHVLNREAFWILEMNTCYPSGLNYCTDLIYLY